MLLISLVVALVALAWVSPFPYWPTYLLLWKTLLKSSAPLVAKRKQALFLVKAAVMAPLWGLFWLLDELIFPQYRKGKIKPVFIIGQPRCGTTLLHRTLATDTDSFFAIRHIEWRYPFITIQKLLTLFGVDKRLGTKNYWSKSDAGQLAAKMHPNTLADWEEDGIFFEENFLHHLFIFLRFPYPEILPALDDFENLPESARTRMMEAHRKVLQKVLFLQGDGEKYYLSKEVTSHNKITSILKLYPDAKFIIAVRSAETFMSSLMALVRMSTQSKTGVDPVTIPGWEAAMIERMRSDSSLLVSLCHNDIPLEKQIRVSATAFMTQIDAVVHEIYRELGLSISDSYGEHIQLLRAKQRGRNRGYDYERIELEGFEQYDDFVQEIDEYYQSHITAAEVIDSVDEVAV